MWTEELYHMYGFDPALPPPPYTEHRKLFTPASWERLSASLANTRETGVPYELELETVKEDGSNGWMWVRGEVTKDSDGNTIGLWGAAQDITERKRTENTLRESEERFRRAVISAPIPIMIHAEDGQVITINTPWTQLTGYKHSDIPTIADWTRKAYSTQMDLVREEIDHLYTLDGPTEEGEYTITTSSGEQRIWDFSSAPIGQLPDGRHLVISMAMDVTERRNIETERKKFYLLAESSSEFIGMCDLDMNPIYVNPAGQRLVGLPDMAAACQIKVQDYFFPEDQCFIAEEFFPRVLREGHGDVEIRLRHFLTGEPIWMYYYLFRVHDAKGTLVGWATVSRDITERKRMLEELEQLNVELERKVRLRTAQLESSNKELEAFSYSVSHDLRAPLRHINGYVNLLNNQFQKSLPEKAGHYLNEVTASAKQMGDLIDDLLQFSRTGRQELRLADMDMNVIIQEAIKVLKTDTENRKISWTVATLPQVIGDSSLLKQVWMNLLDNAVKYTRDKDEAEIEIGFTREPDHWVFFVRDNGAGFDMQYAHKLFGVFQRLHSSEQFEGTGIGLANVQQIVHKHGGRVWASAQTDKGATFNFTIPYDTHRKGDKS
jgi:PAS domain S-box-containing protein